MGEKEGLHKEEGRMCGMEGEGRICKGAGEGRYVRSR